MAVAITIVLVHLIVRLCLRAICPCFTTLEKRLSTPQAFTHIGKSVSDFCVTLGCIVIAVIPSFLLYLRVGVRRFGTFELSTVVLGQCA